jgi:hypothetical protein
VDQVSESRGIISKSFAGTNRRAGMGNAEAVVNPIVVST